MRYGFIGLGNLGGHMAASLLREGFDVTVTDIDPALGKRHLDMGKACVWADTPAELARDCDAIITCLPSPAVSEKVLAEMLTTAKAGNTWIEMSTLGRDDILRLATVASAKGVETMEAPVTGGVHLAAQGKITVLAGGEAHLFDKHKPAFEAMGDKIFHMGPLGS
ncbi:MAG: NAD(P)-dependent oxidoreductase, partial [Hoeflea sp.]|uniref:NAD(P)-dependent oxidoreductase n=1 Tax=Hoeflea sp. TaxID=1940281 RepID=UPI00329A3281